MADEVLITREIRQLPEAVSVPPGAMVPLQPGDGPAVRVPVATLFSKYLAVDVAYEELGAPGEADTLADDLDHDENVIALVYGDPTPGVSGYYRKVGASGTGSWALTTLMLGPPGAPGSSLFSAGTLAEAKLTDVLEGNESVRRISLDDRGGVWMVHTGAALPGDDEDITWFEDLGGTVWRLNVEVPYATMGGADAKGLADSSLAIRRMSATGATRLSFGSYSYTAAQNPVISNITLDPGAQVDGPYLDDVFPVDPDGRTICYSFNALEHQATIRDISTAVTTGIMATVPLAILANQSGFDVIAPLYQDFGLTRVLGPTWFSGDIAWYDWRWNMKTTEVTFGAQDLSRVPLYGFYLGDKVEVLDRIFYDAARFSPVNVITLPGTDAIGPEISSGRWADPFNEWHHFYVMFNQVKNFKLFRWMPWMWTTPDPAGSFPCSPSYRAMVTAAWESLIYNLIRDHRGARTVRKHGKTYVAVYLWDMEGLRAIFDTLSTSSGMHQFLKDRAYACQLCGYDGLWVYARRATIHAAPPGLNYEQGLRDGFGVTFSDYSGMEGEQGTEPDFPALAQRVEAVAGNPALRSATQRMVNIVTARKSRSHPSNFNWPGSTPEWFERAARAGFHIVNTTPNLAREIQINGFSEWAENGAGLMPNKRDGYGYMHALMRAFGEVAHQVEIPERVAPPAFTLLNYNDAATRTLDMFSGSPADQLAVLGQLLFELKRRGLVG